MKFRTEIKLSEESSYQIDYNSTLVLLGSCFVENIGEKLNYFKFKNLINPFGILFNPVAIENLLYRSLTSHNYSEQEIFLFNEQWQCSDSHSRLNSSKKDEILDALNTGLKKTRTTLNEATHVIITLGTSWVYRDKSTDKIVANCHKRPQNEFKKEILSIESIIKSLTNCLNLIFGINSEIKIILTVSPVRHLKDGFVENSLSKANLIAATHQILSDNSRIHYFPSYELMMDELRDYRFYDKDMVHPNDLAIEFIWERFKQVWISPNSYSTMKEVQTVQKGLAHKPFNPNSDSYKKFMKKLNITKGCLTEEFPHIQFT